MINLPDPPGEAPGDSAYQAGQDYREEMAYWMNRAAIAEEALLRIVSLPQGSEGPYNVACHCCEKRDDFAREALEKTVGKE